MTNLCRKCGKRPPARWCDVGECEECHAPGAAPAAETPPPGPLRRLIAASRDLLPGCPWNNCARCKEWWDALDGAEHVEHLAEDVTYWKERHAIEVGELAEARAALAALRERVEALETALRGHVADWRAAAAVREEEASTYPDAPSRNESVAYGRGLARAAALVDEVLAGAALSGEGR